MLGNIIVLYLVLLLSEWKTRQTKGIQTTWVVFLSVFSGARLWVENSLELSMSMRIELPGTTNCETGWKSERRRCLWSILMESILSSTWSAASEGEIEIEQQIQNPAVKSLLNRTRLRLEKWTYNANQEHLQTVGEFSLLWNHTVYSSQDNRATFWLKLLK